ncbi:hypothetical protein [Ruegeria sp. HKCCC1038]|uniref:hypothetical protein n=1 Tax=Ruegeria sp. HKCCC1038 TaxID=2682982 RepID=UPI001487CD28|nr:hypothetical protein [Ruegeria sp. HKCCC1038]
MNMLRVLAVCSLVLPIGNISVAQGSSTAEQVNLSEADKTAMEDLGFNVVEVLDLIGSIKAAYTLKDIEAVRQSSARPMALRPTGRYIPLDSLESFERCRKYIFSDQVVSAVLEEDGSELIVTAAGVALDRGTVWLAPVCVDASCSAQVMAIKTMNVAELEK